MLPVYIALAAATLAAAVALRFLAEDGPDNAERDDSGQDEPRSMAEAA